MNAAVPCLWCGKYSGHKLYSVDGRAIHKECGKYCTAWWQHHERKPSQLEIQLHEFLVDSGHIEPDYSAFE